MKLNFGSKYDVQASDMIEACYEAMTHIMEVYNGGFDVEIKADNSPVTNADKESDKMIRETLSKKYPDYHFLTEESTDDRSRLTAEHIFIVDPLDGTKNFVDRDGMFAVNIALVNKHTPVVGVVGVPVTNKIYFAIKDIGSFVINNKGEEPIRIHVSNKKTDLIMLTSKFHESKDENGIQEMFKDRIKEVRHLGSAIKSCLIAEGKADVSFNFGGNTKEWDTCAPQIIVEQAGGSYHTSKGEEVTYNREDVYNHDGYAIYNNVEGNDLSVQYLKSLKK